MHDRDEDISEPLMLAGIFSELGRFLLATAGVLAVCFAAGYFLI
jgi:hypothetical protein